MDMWFWLLVIVNFVITAWDSYAAGACWDHAKGWFKAVVASAAIVGGVGMFYTFILIGIGIGWLPEDFLIAANVFLGAPLICAGIIVTIHSWQVAIREHKWWQILITIWNTFAVFWDIYVWIRSFQLLGKSLGNITSFLKGGGDSKAKAIIFLIVAAIFTALISYGLFRAGRESTKMYKGEIYG